MSFGSYVAGALELAAITAALGFAAVRVRARWLPGWAGAPARLAEIVGAISAAVVLMEALGTVSLLKPAPLVIGSVLIGLAALWIRPAASGGVPPPSAPPLGPWATAIADGLGALVAMHWAIGVAHSQAIGIYGGDDFWYHLPFAARFTQTGATWDLHYVSPSYLSWFYPANSELFGALGMVAFHRDPLSLVLNLGWMAVALLGGWCLGRPYGVAPLTAAATALVLDLPVLAATQAGGAMNDAFGLAFLLGGLALLVNGWARDARPRPGALALAGAAIGLCLGTKISFVAPAAVLTVAVIVAAAGWRRRAALAWLLPLLATGGYFYLRNLRWAHNPYPWISHLGPIDLPGPNEGLNGAPSFSVAHYLTNGSVWNHYLAPGLSAELGPVWFLLLAGAFAGIVLGLLPRQPVAVRIAALGGLAVVIFYVLTPLGAEGPAGMPIIFRSNLRHLAPAVAIGLALLPIAGRELAVRWRWAMLATLALLTLVATRRGLDFWHSGGALLGAIVIAAFVVLIPFGLARAGSGRRRPGLVAVGSLAAVLVAVGLAWPQTRDYLEHRYTTSSPAWFQRFGLQPVYRWAQGLHDQRIGTSGILQYGLYGRDLSNHVQFLGVQGKDKSFREIMSCTTWRRVINAGHYDYVVAMPRFGGKRAPQVRWTREAGASVQVLRSEPVTVFRITAPLRIGACPKTDITPRA